MSDALFPELVGRAPRIMLGDDVVTLGTVASWATKSADGLYRYVLGRMWNPDRAVLVACMLNPSEADHERNDPTVRRLIGFARRDLFGGLLVCNVHALISTDPEALFRHPDAIGPRNWEAIEACVRRPLLSIVVAAWGAPRCWLRKRCTNTEVTIRSWRSLSCFGKTKDGHPRHPLYLPSDTPIVRWTR